METWKDIDGYFGKYQVSDIGRVKNSEGLVMKQQITKDGYLSVALSVNGKQKRYQVHRLVAMAFLNNANKYPEVNHKDENKTNNNVNNLEWCSQEYNFYYGTGRARNNVQKQKPVEQLKNGEPLKWYDSAKTAESITGICSSHIGDCCRGKRMNAGGYGWRFA